MDVTVKIDLADRFYDLLLQMAGSLSSGSSREADDPKVHKMPVKEKTPKAKAEAEADTDAADTAGAADAEISLEAVKELTLSVKQAGKIDAIKKVLKQFGATRVTDLEKSQYSEYAKLLKAI